MEARSNKISKKTSQAFEHGIAKSSPTSESALNPLRLNSAPVSCSAGASGFVIIHARNFASHYLRFTEREPDWGLVSVDNYLQTLELRGRHSSLPLPVAPTRLLWITHPESYRQRSLQSSEATGKQLRLLHPPRRLATRVYGC